MKKLPDTKEEVSKYIDEIKNKIIISQSLDLPLDNLKKRLTESLKLLEEFEKNEREIARKIKTEELKKDYTEVVRNKEIQKIGEKKVVERELNMSQNTVYIKALLSELEQEILTEHGYKQRNEYSITEMGYITVFVKPELNHSPTHEFLVWNVIEFLKTIKEVKNIQSHLTIYPDITFTYNNKTYALEIERGSLLRKPKQLKDKVIFLNEKYRERWMFIISNKNLLSKYKKFGRATQRKQVSKEIVKMLKK